MPRSSRLKPSPDLIPEGLVAEIKSYRPFRSFISKQKKKGYVGRPFALRAEFNHLSKEKQAKYFHKSVHKYIQLLDDKDIDEHIQVECKLFGYLLKKNEQKKYFESINAPSQPPGTAIPFYTQSIKQDNDDDNDDDNDNDNERKWKSLSTGERARFKKMRKEAIAEYFAHIRNFADDLPERLKTDYLLFSEQSNLKRRMNKTFLANGHGADKKSAPIRQRRKSLTALPESLQTTTIDPPKLTKTQLRDLHKCMPSVLYYEKNIPDDMKPTFSTAMTKNAYIRSLFNELSERERLKYILKSATKWNEFLDSNPNIIQHEIPTLHLLLARSEDILLYFTSLGLPPRPPINSYLLYNQEKDEIGTQESWSDLPQPQKEEYTQRLSNLKNEYYDKLIEFVDEILSADYMRYEFFRNIKYAIKDYELATKEHIIDQETGQLKIAEYYMQKNALHIELNQFNEIKEKLLLTQLSKEQKVLVDQLTVLFEKRFVSPESSPKQIIKKKKIN